MTSAMIELASLLTFEGSSTTLPWKQFELTSRVGFVSRIAEASLKVEIAARADIEAICLFLLFNLQALLLKLP